MTEGGGGRNVMAMSSPSCAKQTPMPTTEAASKYNPYPAPLARYEDVVANSKLFLATLEKLHATMATKFMIPIIGGKELDLHRLFVEVTSRGGIEKIIQLRRWKEVTATFNFPSTATNASFVLRKYYVSLLHHYEQIYFFKAKGWTPISSDSLQSPCTAPILIKGVVEAAVASPEIQAATTPQQRTSSPEFLPGASPALSSGSPVIGIIDGKFESGYLVTISIGSEKLKGIVYQSPQNPVRRVQLNSSLFSSSNDNKTASSSLQRRRRRKKSEIKRRDPAHPKPNRSGYNFFFSEQHTRLRLLHPGKDREISRMIGELWTKLKESDKAVYQEIAIKDKERYRTEMEDYRETMKTGQIISDAVPIQQRLPEFDSKMVESDLNVEETVLENENSSSAKTDSENEENMEKVLDMEASPREEVGYVDMKTSAGKVTFDSKKRVKVGDESIGDVCDKESERISTD